MAPLGVMRPAGLLAAAWLAGGGAPRHPPVPQAPDRAAIQALQEDVAIAGLLARLRDAPVPEVTIIRDVRVVDPVDATVTPRQSVVIADGHVALVVKVGSEPQVPNARILDGGDHFLSPGLTDMHVHSHWASAWLLDLANGVTTVREMDGFPWLLDVRAHVADGRMLGPTLYVAGTIINADALGGYAVTPSDALDARRIVRQQAACGYDFIKIHNILPRPIFDAVAAEAARVGLALVGHVPHDIPVRYAVDHGMRTMEHLKGFLNDGTLQMGDTDYAAAANPNVWVTPTLYAGRGFASPEAQRMLLAEPASRYVPARRRGDWAGGIERPQDDFFRLNVHGEELRRQITRALAATPGVQFLAGTDAAFYSFGVMGFALVEELQLLQQNGLSPADVMRSATSSPALAMGVPEAFGRIRAGMRADFVLLTGNPLEGAAAYRTNLGVMVRGRWLDRPTLDASLARLAELYAHPDTLPLSRGQTEALVARARALAAAGYVFSAPLLLHAADALRRQGYVRDADVLAGLADAPTTGPCAAPVPS